MKLERRDSRCARASGASREYGSQRRDRRGLMRKYLECKAIASASIKAWSKKKWLDAVSQAAKDLVSGNRFGEGPRRAWRFFLAVADTKRRRLRSAWGGLTPMKSTEDENTILTCSEDISANWYRHFGRLTRDVTGHSRDPEYWKAAEEEEVEQLGGSELDAEFTCEELHETICGLKSGSAAGDSGIPYEVWKDLSLWKPSVDWTKYNNRKEENLSKFGKAALAVTRNVFKTGYISESENVGSIVPILKGGDATLVDNYRGITLINCELKIIAKLVADRLSKLLEKGRPGLSRTGRLPLGGGNACARSRWP